MQPLLQNNKRETLFIPTICVEIKSNYYFNPCWWVWKMMHPKFALNIINTLSDKLLITSDTLPCKISLRSQFKFKIWVNWITRYLLLTHLGTTESGLSTIVQVYLARSALFTIWESKSPNLPKYFGINRKWWLRKCTPLKPN